MDIGEVIKFCAAHRNKTGDISKYTQQQKMPAKKSLQLQIKWRKKEKVKFSGNLVYSIIDPPIQLSTLIQNTPKWKGTGRSTEDAQQLQFSVSDCQYNYINLFTLVSPDCLV